jgi:hypothetical protein
MSVTDIPYQAPKELSETDQAREDPLPWLADELESWGRTGSSIAGAGLRGDG